MTRKDARELLMQAVFQMDIQDDHSNELLELFLSDKNVDKKNGDFIRSTFESIRRNILHIDDTIDKYATNWNVKRMPKTDLAILRVAIGEMFYSDEIADAIAINEAVEMAKKYCGEESSKFINGVLGSVSRSQDA